MRISKRALVVAFAAGAVALSMALAVGVSGSAGGGDGKGSLLKQSLAPSVPGDPTFHGVNPGGAPWVLDRGEARLNGANGLVLRVEGLVIPNPPGDGTPGPVMTISASLYCGADSDTVAADTTTQVPISRDGDALIRDRSFAVPSTCLAPVIMVHPNGITGTYITVGGWRL
jgi:hypothetical protein